MEELSIMDSGDKVDSQAATAGGTAYEEATQNQHQQSRSMVLLHLPMSRLWNCDPISTNEENNGQSEDLGAMLPCTADVSDSKSVAEMQGQKASTRP
jgi:hypothetical protein